MEVIHGNIFTTECQTIVNTVNCFGVMGAGIALECKYRYPEMNERYVELCQQKLLNIGQLYLYKSSKKWILNFPTKHHWKFQTKKEYLERGLKKIVDTYKEKGIESIAFPLLGASHGGLTKNESLEIMERYLKKISIPYEVYSYNPNTPDDLFPIFKAFMLENDLKKIRIMTDLTHKQVDVILKAIRNNQVNNMNSLEPIKGIGEKAIQKCFTFAMSKEIKNIQSKFF